MDALITAESPASQARPLTVDAVRWPGTAAPGRARLRLYCLPHAGGGAVSYLPWSRRLAPDIEVVAVRLPGRENRHRERPARRLGQLVPAVTRILSGDADGPFAVFGHSLGALLAFEACRELARLDLRQPVRLLVSGRTAPQLPSRVPPIHAAPDEALYQRLRDMGGTPPELLADPEVMAGLLPTLRADMEAAETYEYRPGPALNVPLSVFGGAQDRFADRRDIEPWGEHTRAGCRVRVYPGRHFFLHEDPEPVLRDLVSDLSTFHPAAP
ncbi:thioesterase II family protein [Catenulispora rubra]|uniref:thioesterase II family protein n=1 Tax=Catenulispora rubra TaxID=280293 RepID=UPI0018920D5E|nr:alpha/beta fold hydrolase [Catenulispora rubra]